MIEIVFGESACGSLKIAQTYGKGKYRGSAVSIFMRHEDGSVPSSDEMKKAQLQAQEQERIAWENAIPLGGKSSDVYCFDMALSVGDISDNGIGEQRKNIFKKMLSVCFVEDLDYQVEEKIQKIKTTLSSVIERYVAGEEVRIWYSYNPDELCGMYWLMKQLRPLNCQTTIYLVKLPTWEYGKENTMTSKIAWGEVSPGEWGNGQRQRILLARAICQEPEIIILDEPTSFLDIRHKLELLAILKKMVLEKQMTVIMSLHELDLAQKISDQVICVHGDHIEKYGAPEEIFTSDYIRKLYGITRGSYNAEFGCVEMEPPAGKPEVFVIGGNGSGIPVYRKLQRQGIPFVTGVLHTNDADYQVAKELAAKVITEKPFECISESAFEEALEFMGKCEKVYCPLKDFGIMNEKNRELLKKAKETGKLNQIR